MAIIRYTKQDEYDLANSGQECIGWSVFDQAGNRIGTVSEMLIDTEREMVDSILVDQHLRIPAADFAMKDKMVVVRGVVESDAARRNEMSGNLPASEHQDYAALPRSTNAKHVTGITREADETEITVPVVEEELRVGKRTINRGGARIQTRVEETPVEERVALREENVTVERRPANRLVENAPGAFKEGVIEVTETSEVPVVDKQVRVVEEIAIGKQITEHEETIRETVRRRDVDVHQFTNDKNDRADR